MWENLEEAKQNLEEIKKSLKAFLLRTYDDEETATNTFNYLGRAVSRIIKKDSIKIEFSKGGDVVWYMNVFNYVANWLEAEKKTSDLLNKELEEINGEDAAS
jgi:hypothetical protein